MNDMAYLQQISAGTNPSPASSSLFSGRAFRLLGIFAAAALVIILALALLSAATPKESSLDVELSRINLRASSLNELISSYNSSVKSSSLRASGASLSVLLTELASSSSSSLETLYGISASDLSLSSDDAALLDKSSSALESARLNGILDRAYASELSYQISHLLILEELALSKSSNSAVSDYLSSSYSSLTTLQSSFSNFSETK
ncbi:hypothetical protein IJ095_02170 [Candidatus Saccharibacteria bacterium]|nr:hypothetical protein [Candidatus Saccharibacteria bacterium]